MNTKSALICTALILPGAILAQERTQQPQMSDRSEVNYEPRHAIELRLKEYQEALELSEEQMHHIADILTRGEQEEMPLRKECDAIQMKIQRLRQRATENAESILDDDQKRQLANMRQEGKFNASVSSCGTARTDSAGEACCAAKAAMDKRAARMSSEAAPDPQPSTAPAREPRTNPAPR